MNILNNKTKAIFIDRDGTINLNKQGHIYLKKDFEFTPRAVEALQRLSKLDFKIIIISNQAGIAKGYYDEKALHDLHDFMMNLFKKNHIKIHSIYFCPHQPNNQCDCRKPKLGMLEKAVQEHAVDLSQSWLIGDDAEKDILLGRRAGVKTIQVLIENRIKHEQIQPNFYAENLNKAVDIIFNH